MIEDAALANMFAIEAVALFDHYHFRKAMQKVTASEPPLTLWYPGKPNAPQPWWKAYYDPTRIQMRDRYLFAGLPLPAGLSATKNVDWSAIDAAAAVPTKRAAKRDTPTRDKELSKTPAEATPVEQDARKAPAKKASTKKPSIKKPSTKKLSTKKARINKTVTKKTRTKKAGTKKVVAKKAPAKEVPAKKARKTAARRLSTKKKTASSKKTTGQRKKAKSRIPRR
jgi:hypothetical protein